jgi:hypothetical protein
MKCCNTCKYGVISEFLEKRGDSCCIICARMSKPLKGKLYLHSKDDKCRSYEPDVINKLISGELNE